MARLIKIHEIDQFSDVVAIPDASINETIRSNVARLDEVNQLERFLREILYDPNETPHGPTEIADVITSLYIRGTKVLAAFVIKGKSFHRVTSRDVTHQFAKLRQIDGLGLMVFAAVGSIQDDAQRDFVQAAFDYGTDYLIIDTQGWARLLIAYDKICPKDGTPYAETGACEQGHQVDDGLTLEMEVREQIRYTVLSQKDISHAGAKRYSAVILLDKHYTKDVLRSIIVEATEKLRNSNYYRNKQTKDRWGKTKAHVVWLFLFCELDDVSIQNWVCRTCWIDPTLDPDMRPAIFTGDENVENIEVDWNDQHKAHETHYKDKYGTKEELLETLQPLLDETIQLADKGIDNFLQYQKGVISDKRLISRMKQDEPRIGEIYDRSGNLPIPPQDCKDYEDVCQCIFTDVHNIFLFFSERGLQTWTTNKRDLLLRNTIKQYHKDKERLKFEESKLH